MWDGALGTFIQQSVPINDAVVSVGKHGEINAGLIFEFVAQEVRLVVRVYAHGQDFDLVAVGFVYNRFQLAKLSSAPRSPIAAIEHQHDGLFAAISRKVDGFAVLIFQHEIGRGVTGFDAR